MQQLAQVAEQAGTKPKRHQDFHKGVAIKWTEYEPRHEKTNILVSDLVRPKPGCTATEDG